MSKTEDLVRYIKKKKKKKVKKDYLFNRNILTEKKIRTFRRFPKHVSGHTNFLDADWLRGETM